MAGFAWSYSALTMFEQCGKRYAALRVYKTHKEIEGEQMLYGQRVHKSLEYRIKDHTALPHDLTHLEKTLQVLEKTGKCNAEQKIALDRSYRVTDYFDKASTMPDRRVWLRIVIDLQVMLANPKYAILIDYKTGKEKEDLDQLELFAAVMFAMHPELREVRTGYLWTSLNKVVPKKFERDEAPIIWQKFIPRVKRFENAYNTNGWTANPSGLCKKHCPVTDCPFYGRGAH